MDLLFLGGLLLVPVAAVVIGLGSISQGVDLQRLSEEMKRLDVEEQRINEELKLLYEEERRINEKMKRLD